MSKNLKIFIKNDKVIKTEEKLLLKIVIQKIKVLIYSTGEYNMTKSLNKYKFTNLKFMIFKIKNNFEQ